MSSRAAGPPSPLDFLPARWVPLLYLGFAHASLAAAFAVIAFDPRAVAGFYYHPRLVAVVHMVGLGWISGSILGSLYVIGPLAFRMALPAGRADYLAFAAFSVGVAGMVSHFWIDRLTGMAWSALLVVACLAFVAARVLRELRRAPVPAEARLPVALALANVLAAAAAGVLVGLDKAAPFLPAPHLPAVLAHAHLAALGWAAMMVIGAGYRMLPMILPSAMPRGPWAHAATLATQAGAWSLFLAFLAGRWIGPAALAAAAGVALFLAQVIWMARNRRPAPREMPRPDWSAGHALQALGYLALAAVLGVGLAFAPRSETALRGALAYGVLGLVGFLSQMVVGVAGRLLPLYAWLWGFADRGHRENPPSLHRAPSRMLQAIVLLLWSAGVPALAAGFALDRPPLISAAGVALSLAVALGAANLLLMLRRLWRFLPGGSSPQGPWLEAGT
jgi:hypothetical protein